MKTEYKTHPVQRERALENYYLKREKYLQAAKDYYWMHREEKNEYYKQWREKNRDKLLARRREKYALTHPKKEKIPKPEKSRKPEKSVAAPKTPRLPKPKPEPKPKSQQIFYTPPEISCPYKEASFEITWD